MIKKILIANRGEIACRIMKTARKMGIQTVAVYSEADQNALHVRMADEAVLIGPPAAGRSYLMQDNIMAAVRQTGADAVHPGYGFLSENAVFAARLEREGVIFIGPPSTAIAAMGDKITSKQIAGQAGVSTVPGHMGIIADKEEAVRIAAGIGYPVMIKASAGGGGKGMRIARHAVDVREGFEAAQNEARASFGDGRIFIEKFITRPRHIEIQVLADHHGNYVYLFERECSIQRRNQKVIEEAPSAFLTPETRRAMGQQACALARAVGYHSAGTVEFIVDGAQNFYFLEMNTRLQVEHPVTELITGIDLVEQMILIAAGRALAFTQDDLAIHGWAIEARLYAENPYRNFLPSIGRLTRYRPPAEGATAQGGIIRNDTGVFEGGEISLHYDPMIAKLCSWAPNRLQAIEEMRRALDRFEVEGISHNLPFCAAVMGHPRFMAGDITTAFIEEEYQNGFAGVTVDEDQLRRIAAVAAVLEWRTRRRRWQGTGRMNDKVPAQDDWHVSLCGRQFILHLSALEDGMQVMFDGGHSHHVQGAWVPGQHLADMQVDKADMVLNISPVTRGFHIMWRGADMKVMVQTPAQAALAGWMIEKPAADTSKSLLCPMPGLVSRIMVTKGQEVQEGEAVAIVEAMKMENILRAPRRAMVHHINVQAGDSLKVDEVIMTFDVRM